MPAKNEIVPLDVGPTQQTLTSPAKPPVHKSVRHEANVNANTNANTNVSHNLAALNSQEGRIRLVALQRRYTACQLFYAAFGVAIMVVQMEYLWFANTKGFSGVCGVDPSTQCPACKASLASAVPVADGRMMLHALRVLLSLSTLLLLYYIRAFYVAECDVLKIKNLVPPTATLLSSPLRYPLVLELLVFAIHPFPGLEAIDPQWPNLVIASSLCMFPRFFLLFRMLQFRDAFNSSNGWFIGALTNVDFSAAFFLKATLRNRPSRWLLVSFALLLLATSYALFVVERFLCAFHADSCCAPIQWTDALWTLVITMLTIGYGDVVPRTAAGRFISVLAGLFGTMFTAVTIAVMSTYLVLTRSEHKVNAFIKKDENRRLIQNHAARAIQAFVHVRAVQRRGHGLAKAENKLYEVLRVYRQVKRFVKSHDVSDPMDKQMTMLEMMEVNVEYIRTKIEDLNSLFHAQAEMQYSTMTTTATAKRKLQSAAAAMAMATAQVTARAVACAVAGSGTSNAADGGSSSATETEAPPGVVTASLEPTPSTTFVSRVSSQSSSSSLPQSGHRPTYESDGVTEIDSHRSNGVTHAIGGQDSTPPQQAAMSTAPPAWAIAMEKSMQAILLQVARVSDEVDSLRSRVETQMDQLQDRLGDMEKRVGIQDAVREITRGTQIRKSLLHESSGRMSDMSDGSMSSNTTVSGGTNGSFALGGPIRNTHSRTSFAQPQQRPSIHSFVTSKDLEEFHNNGSAID